MASQTPDHQKLSGIKAYLRYKSVEELAALADCIFTAAVEEVTITGSSADGGSANGEVTFPKWLYLQAVMDVRAEKGDLPTNENGQVIGRSLGSMPDFSGLRWSV